MTGGSVLGIWATTFGPWSRSTTETGQALYAGGVSANRIARWNGSAWSALEPAASVGTDAGINAMATFTAGGATRLYIGGTFVTAGGRSAARLARWGCGGGCYANGDGSTSQPLLNINDFIICFQSRFIQGCNWVLGSPRGGSGLPGRPGGL